jgi:hypothetical protein
LGLRWRVLGYCCCWGGGGAKAGAGGVDEDGWGFGGGRSVGESEEGYEEGVAEIEAFVVGLEG